MYSAKIKNHVLLAILLVYSITSLAQDVTITTTATRSVTGNKKFRKFSFGINAGALYPAVATGGTLDYSQPKFSLGYGANIKYQILHWFALQGDFLRGNVKGNNEGKNGDGIVPSPRSFNTDLHYSGSLNAVISVSVKNKMVPYVSFGGGFATYDVLINKTSNGDPNESFASDSPLREYFVQAAMGLKFSISRRLNLDLGYRMHYIDGDNFDGKAFFRDPVDLNHKLHKDKFSYGFLGLEFSLGNKSKQQLMFLDPIEELRKEMVVEIKNEVAAQLKDQISHLQTQIDTLNIKTSQVDTDGDGVADQFDKEPGTPAGCPVNFQGISRDTDGDGVPDCKDKQLITPTDCQPVDADGVGKCSPTDASHNANEIACKMGELPSVSFKPNVAMLTESAKGMLAVAASKLKSNPGCTVTISGYTTTSKISQASCNKRVEAIKNYLVESEGISSERIITNCVLGGGDANTVDIKSN